MKHIFTIHSHITFLAALGVMATDKIDTNEVVLITGSNYKPQVSPAFCGKIVNALDTEMGEYSMLQKIKNFNYTNAAHQYINKITEGQSYIAYIDLMSVFNRYLVRDVQCVQFHIIEEGIVNYADFDDFNLWTADLRQFDWQWTGLKNWRQMLNGIVRLLRGRSIKLLAMPIHPNLYTLHKGVNAYCFSDLAFQYTRASQKIIMSWHSIKPYVQTETNIFKNGDWFWIGDMLCSFYKIPLDVFEIALGKLMEEINPNKNEITIYLKFRGGESKEEKELTVSYLQRFNFNVVYIQPDQIMELVFLDLKDIKVCGIASSLLIYANLMGHQTYSIYKNIPNSYGVSLNDSYKTISKKVGYIC